MTVASSTIESFTIVADSPVHDSEGYDNIDFRQNGELDVLAKALAGRPRPIVFDIGANKGHWSRLVLDIEPDSELYAFEPVPETFRLLQQEIQAPGARLMNLAVSDQDGTRIFYHWNDDAQRAELSSLYRRPDVERSLSASVAPISVASRTLDGLCRELAVEQVDFLKIDTEGAELAVLEGASGLLGARRVRVVQFEYGGTYLDSRITLARVYDFLRGHGYEVCRILPTGLLHVPRWRDALETYRYSNYVAMPSVPGGPTPST